MFVSVMRSIVLILVLLLSVPLQGQKWERLTEKFKLHYDEDAYEAALDDALKALGQAVKDFDTTDVRYMISYYNVALAYHGLSEMEMARSAIASAFELMVPVFTYDPNHAEVCELYGRIETSLGYHQNAEAYLSRARDIKIFLYGKESREYIRSLYFLADLEMARSRWDEMAAVLEEALEIHEHHFIKDQDFARYANYLGLIYMNGGQDAAAALNFQRAISAFTETGIEKNFTFGHANNNLALVYYYESDFEQAAIHFERADSIYRLLLEGYSENYMMLLNNIASLYYSWGKADQARQAYRQLEEYLARYPDPRDLNYLQGVENTAHFYANSGELKRAGEYYLKSIGIRKSVPEPDSVDLAWTMLSLASVYSEGSRPDLAAEVAVEAFLILRDKLAPGDPDLVWLLSFLGLSHFESRQEQKAIYYYELAREQVELDDSLHYEEEVSIYNNLGILYHEQEMLREAVRFLEKAHALDPEEPATLINLGLTYFDMGDHPGAREKFEEAKKIYEREYGRDHPDYANALIHDISFRASYGDFNDQMLEDIREVERICLSSHVDTTSRLFIDCMASYGSYYFGIKDYHRSVAYGKRVLKLVELAYGRNSKFYGENLLVLADSYVMLGDLENLIRIYNEAYEIASSLDPAEGESLLYFIESGRCWDYYYLEDYEESRKSMERVIEKDKARFLALQNILSVRERSNFSAELVNLVEYNNFVMLGPEDPEVLSNALDNRLFVKGLLMDSERRQRDALASSGDSIIAGMHERYLAEKRMLANLQSQFGVEKLILDSMEQGIMQIEREISRRLGEKMALEERSLHWQDIRDSLGEDEAAVEVVMFYHRTAPPVVTLHPWYLAFIITRETRDHPLCLKLFDAVEAIPDYLSYRGAMESGPGGRLDAGLYDRLWAKIDSALDGKKTIFFSPDGLFHQLNVEALADGAGHYVIDKYEIRVVNSLAEILEPARDYGHNMRAMLAGDPMFRMSLASVPDPVPGEAARSVSGFQTRMFPGTRLSPLPGTRTEVDSIGSMLEASGWECATLTGPDASEEAVSSVRNPRVLHLATHGYFARDENHSGDTLSGSTDRSFNALGMESYSRSCLFFSGAQSTLYYAYDYREGSGDGILTAWEIMEMELDSTELVVLSACETGLGDVLNSEGVSGLRRAFHLAGAERVLLSLWEVDDQATQLLMREFYANWLSGMELDRALAEAKRTLMRSDEYSHPRYWAAFILSGI
jgi:CHAT domain-containing protein/tetratricopeptide (TPR) repeat protein